MAKSSGSFSKRDKENKRLQKRKEKEQRKEARKAGSEPKSFEDMLAYVDENGNLTSTPPDQSTRRPIEEASIELGSRNKGSHLPELREGVVKHFDDSRGFGFIKDIQTSEEFFFHMSSASFPIASSDRVTFKTERGPKGFNAVSITKASNEPQAPPGTKP